MGEDMYFPLTQGNFENLTFLYYLDYIVLLPVALHFYCVIIYRAEIIPFIIQSYEF